MAMVSELDAAVPQMALEHQMAFNACEVLLPQTALDPQLAFVPVTSVGDPGFRVE